MSKTIIFDAGGVLHTNEVKYIYDDIKQTLKLSEEDFTRTYRKIDTAFTIRKNFGR